MADTALIHDLVLNPRETLTIELKAWIDPSTAHGKSKIAKCLLALRNMGGGFMVLGFDDETHQPASEGRPDDVRVTYHGDTIQVIVSQYASELFEVITHHPKRDDLEYVVIEVPGGFKSPVAARADLKDPNDKSLLIRQNDVYTRTLEANGSVSTAPATWRDWAQIVERCLDNREADTARFVRKHFADLPATLLDQLTALLRKERLPDAEPGVPQVSPEGAPKPPSSPAAAAEVTVFPVKPPEAESEEAIAKAALNDGDARFKSIVAERNLTLPPYGSWEVAAVVRPALPRAEANLAFLGRMFASNPTLTGWPTWVDSREFADKNRPFYRDGGWESLIIELDDGYQHIDFWRMSPDGRFYQRRPLEDDTSPARGRPKPGTKFDFSMPIWRSAEAIAVALELAKHVDGVTDQSLLTMGFRWRGLEGRELSTWADPMRIMISGRRAYRDDVISVVATPVKTEKSGIYPLVGIATRRLFEVFAGFEVPQHIIEEIARTVLERRR